MLAKSKRELIVTFLVLLELVKYAEIILVQREVFGDIFARQRASEIAPVEIIDTYEKLAEPEAETIAENQPEEMNADETPVTPEPEMALQS